MSLACRMFPLSTHLLFLPQIFNLWDHTFRQRRQGSPSLISPLVFIGWIRRHAVIVYTLVAALTLRCRGSGSGSLQQRGALGLRQSCTVSLVHCWHPGVAKRRSRLYKRHGSAGDSLLFELIATGCRAQQRKSSCS